MDDLKEPTQIVAIGASAGGMNALSEFFSTMPADSGLAFVVIQHLDPHHQSHMAGLLAKMTPMKAVQAEDRMAIETNCVYTIPAGKFLAVENGLLRLSEPVKSDGIRLPIDFFLRSLAQDRHEKSIAVLLSGSGSDGTIGIREVVSIAYCRCGKWPARSSNTSGAGRRFSAQSIARPLVYISARSST